MSAIILFGAGASFGSGDCRPYPPPLGKHLFAELRGCGGVAASIDGRLAEMFESDFEEGMAAFRDSRDTDTTAFLREMAAYFAQFNLGRHNLYRDLVGVARRSVRPVTLVTTNYDLLPELAISESDLRISYAGHPVPRRNVAMLKIHGSCHFLPDLESNTIRGSTFSGCTVNVAAPARIATSALEVMRFCATEDSLAPAMAVYAPGKRVLFCPDFVKRQLVSWQREVARVAVTYVIGMRVLPEDDHVWGELAKAPGRLCYVGLEPDEFLSWSDAVGRKNSFVLAPSFESAMPIIRRQITR